MVVQLGENVPVGPANQVALGDDIVDRSKVNSD